jgi:hypothetical protein
MLHPNRNDAGDDMDQRSIDYGAALDAKERVLVAIGRAPALRSIEEAARASGARVAASIDPEGAPARLAMQARLHVIALDLASGDSDSASAAALDAVAAAAQRHDARVIASFPQEAIDLVAGALEGLDAQLLCAPSSTERVTALAIAAPTGSVLHDAARESEQQRLRHLNDEVARIAETLARLARDDTPLSPPATAVADRSPPFRAAPDEREVTIEPAQVRAAIRARRMRDQFFEGALFADPAWDMLLDLFAAHLEHARVSVSSLCIAAAVPPTTALRWITTMREAGLLVRRDDPFDRRRAFVGLSETALAAMRRYCAALKRAGLAIP